MVSGRTVNPEVLSSTLAPRLPAHDDFRAMVKVPIGTSLAVRPRYPTIFKKRKKEKKKALNDKKRSIFVFRCFYSQLPTLSFF